MAFQSPAANNKKVLFLCTGNSCRSQIAEAIVNSWDGDRWIASSAGTIPAGFIHPLAFQVLDEIGIHHEGQSKNVDEFRTASFDLVVTVCDSAAEECPVWLGEGRKVHLGFPDPVEAKGSEDEVLGVFRAVRDDIAAELDELLDN